MPLTDTVIAHFLQIEMGLYHAYVRLQARTDGEALHDLRINLRRLRSLLRPLRKITDVAELEAVTAQLTALTTPARDLEVLIHELAQQGYTTQGKTRTTRLHQHYAEICQSTLFEQLFSLSNQWPANLRAAERAGELRKLKKHIKQKLGKQLKRLRQALAMPQSDLHHLRLLIKLARYASEAYPALSPYSKRASEALKLAQTILGDWHDHFQWCLQTTLQPDLQKLLPTWQLATETALANAEKQLPKLADLL
jgi:CHAD domain-containing protein